MPRSERIGLVSAQMLLAYARSKASVNEQDPDWGPGSQLTVADVTLILDLAKARPEVFTQTIKVVDPVLQTPEECLECFSSCMSSTYTGVFELGASAAQLEVVLEAWKICQLLETKSDELRWKLAALTYAAATLSWLAILLAVLVMELERCQDDSRSSSLCGVIHASWNLSVLKAVMVILPILAGLFQTMLSQFQFREKWASTKIAAAEIVKQIFLFRGMVGCYSTESRNTKQGAAGEDSDDQETEGLSAAALARMVRMKFVNSVTTVNSAVVASLKDDYLRGTAASNNIKPENLQEIVLSLLYQEQRSRSFWQQCVCICNCKQTSKSMKAKPHEDEEATYTLMDNASDGASTVTELLLGISIGTSKVISNFRFVILIPTRGRL